MVWFDWLECIVAQRMVVGCIYIVWLLVCVLRCIGVAVVCRVTFMMCFVLLYYGLYLVNSVVIDCQV